LRYDTYVNDDFAELKLRLRKAEDLLQQGGGVEQVALAQAISRTRRLVRDADRSRAPTPQLRDAISAVEALTHQAR